MTTPRPDLTTARDALAKAIASVEGLSFGLVGPAHPWMEGELAARILAALPDGWTLAREAGVSVEALAEALRERCKDCRTPDQSGTRNGYSCGAHRDIIAAARSAGSGSRVECDETCNGDCPNRFRPTPPPAVDGTRCAECGGVKDDVFHVPCLVGGPFHYVKTCHPFTPPAPAPDERLRALEAALLDASTGWHAAMKHAGPWGDCEQVMCHRERALLAPDGKGSRS